MENTEEKKYCVYKHTSPSKKVYIGITRTKPEKRWGKDGVGYNTQQYFYRAIQKYGWDNFEHEILYTKLTKEEAEQMEIDLIAYYKSNQREFGYNIENGGNATGKMSEETRQKISAANKGRVSPNKGKPMSDEQKKKLSESKIGKTTGPRSEETKKKISEANKGKVVSDDTRQKISNIRKTCWADDNYRQNQVEKHKWQTGENHPWFGKHHSDETKEKMRDVKTKAYVWCIELHQLFYSPEDVQRRLGVDASDVRKACKGLKKSAGKHPITKEKLHWKFVPKDGEIDEDIIVRSEYSC